MTAATSAGLSARDVLKIPDFRKLWLGQIVSNFGDALTHLTLVLLINRLTGSPAAIAYLLIALALPPATLGLVAGVFVDRWDRKKVMIISDAVRGVLVLGFILVGTHPDRLWLIWVIAFLHGAAGSFFAPARSAVIPLVVPAEGLLAANSLSQTSVVLLRVVGTAVAGVLVGVLDGFTFAFGLDALTFFLSIFFVAQVALPAAAPSGATSARVIWEQLSRGFSLIARSRPLLGTLVGAGMMMLGVGAINVLLVPLLVNDMGVSETWFGAIDFAQVAAMIISGSFVAVLAARFKTTHLISTCLVFIGVFLALMSLIGSVWHLLPILFAVGLFVTPLSAGIATLTQVEVANESRGRVSAALNAVIQTASLISMFAAGMAADLLGVRLVFVLGGVLTIAAGIGAAVVFRGYQAPAARKVPSPAQAFDRPDSHAAALADGHEGEVGGEIGLDTALT